MNSRAFDVGLLEKCVDGCDESCAPCASSSQSRLNGVLTVVGRVPKRYAVRLRIVFDVCVVTLAIALQCGVDCEHFIRAICDDRCRYLVKIWKPVMDAVRLGCGDRVGDGREQCCLWNSVDVGWSHTRGGPFPNDLNRGPHIFSASSTFLRQHGHWTSKPCWNGRE